MRNFIIGSITVLGLVTGCSKGPTASPTSSEVSTPPSSYTSQLDLDREQKAKVDQEINQIENELGLSAAHVKDYGSTLPGDETFLLNYGDKGQLSVLTEGGISQIIGTFAGAGNGKVMVAEYSKKTLYKVVNTFNHRLDETKAWSDDVYQNAYENMMELSDNLQKGAAVSLYYTMLNEFYLFQWGTFCSQWGDTSAQCGNQEQTGQHLKTYTLLKILTLDKIERLKKLAEEQFNLYLATDKKSEAI